MLGGGGGGWLAYWESAVFALGLGLEVDLTDQLRDLALLHQRVDMQDRFVAGSEHSLMLKQIQDLQLRLKVGDGGHEALPTTEHKACRDFCVLDARQS